MVNGKLWSCSLICYDRHSTLWHCLPGLLSNSHRKQEHRNTANVHVFNVCSEERQLWLSHSQIWLVIKPLTSIYNELWGFFILKENEAPEEFKVIFAFQIQIIFEFHTVLSVWFKLRVAFHPSIDPCIFCHYFWKVQLFCVNVKTALYLSIDR